MRCPLQYLCNGLEEDIQRRKLEAGLEASEVDQLVAASGATPAPPFLLACLLACLGLGLSTRHVTCDADLRMSALSVLGR